MSTKDEDEAFARKWLIQAEGRPIEMDAAARDRFHERLGLLVDFLGALRERNAK